ncbi:MAG: hypothetical protein ACK40G_05405 [Cytophagaceae bacterium]
MGGLDMRSKALKTLRKDAAKFTRQVGITAKDMANDFSKQISKIDVDNMAKSSRKQLKLWGKQANKLYAKNAKKLAKSDFMKDIQKGTFIPKRYKLVSNWISANGKVLNKWTKKQARSINKWSASTYPVVKKFVKNSYSDVKVFFSNLPKTSQMALARLG